MRVVFYSIRRHVYKIYKLRMKYIIQFEFISSAFKIHIMLYALPQHFSILP